MKKKIAAVMMSAVMAAAPLAMTWAPSVMAADDPIEISFWHSMDGDAGAVVDQQVEDFNNTVGAEKGIHVTEVFQDWPGTDALTAAMTTDDTDNMPDVIQLYGESVDLVRSWDRTAWVEDYISKDEDLKKEDLLDSAVASYSIKGKLIGAPYTLSTLLLYYNEDLLNEAGITEAPATIDDLAKAMTAIKEKGSADYALNLPMQYFEFVSYIVNQGKEGTYFGNNESGHDGPMTELACSDQIDAFLNEWQKVVDTGALKPTKDSVNEEFAQGLNAMTIMSNTRITAINDLVGDSFKWNVAPVPKVSADDIGGGYPSGSGLFMVNRDDQKKLDAAWEFVKYCLSPDVQAMWPEKYSYVPVNKNSLDTDTYKNAVKAIPQQDVSYQVLSSMPATVVAPFTPASDEVGSVIKDSMLAFGEGSATAEETASAIKDGIASAFEDYFRANPVEES